MLDVRSVGLFGDLSPRVVAMVSVLRARAPEAVDCAALEYALGLSRRQIAQGLAQLSRCAPNTRRRIHYVRRLGLRWVEE